MIDFDDIMDIWISILFFLMILVLGCACIGIPVFAVLCFINTFYNIEIVIIIIVYCIFIIMVSFIIWLMVGLPLLFISLFVN